LKKTVFVDLDGLTTFTEFKQNLKAFSRVGNGQMIADPAVFAGLTDAQIKEIAKLARKSGVHICIDLRKEKDMSQKLR